MSEYVEETIEGLLPVVEVLKGLQLLSEKEIDAFIKRCKSYTYRLQKARKDSESFKTYIDYLKSTMKLIRMRRKRMKYRQKEIEIEGAIKNQIDTLYKLCCERFQGRKDMWVDRIDFLKSEKMYIRCSKAYFRAMQIYPRDIALRIQAARFEYSMEQKIECARYIMQQGVRLDPNEPFLWTSFVQLELDYVKWLTARKSLLTGKDQHFSCTEDKEMQVAKEAQKSADSKIELEGPSGRDAVMSLRLVETIIKQALESCVKGQCEMLLDFWRITKRYGLVAEHLAKKLYDKLWTSEFKSEESWIAKSESFSNVDQETLYELFDKAIEDRPSEKMYRHYLTVCNRHYSVDRDPDAKAKCKELLLWLITQGRATETDIKKFDLVIEDAEQKEKILNEQLQRFPENAYLWMVLLRCKIKKNPEDAEEIRKLFNKATREVHYEYSGLSDLYKLAINWAIKYSPKDVDDFFQRAAFRTAPAAASEMRCLRLNYLESVHPKNPEKRREEYFLFAKHPPNSMEVHRSFIRHELNSDFRMLPILHVALEFMVAEFGHRTHESWIEYADCMLKFDPTVLQSIYRRAVAALPAFEVERFLTAYGYVMQKAAARNLQKNGGRGNDRDDSDDDDDDLFADFRPLRAGVRYNNDDNDFDDE